MNCRQDFKVKCRNCALLTQNKSCFELHEESNCQVSKNVQTACITYQNGGHMYVMITNGVLIATNQLIYCIDVIFIMKKNLKLKTFEGFVFFDFKSYLNEENEHVVNQAMAQKVCKKC